MKQVPLILLPALLLFNCDNKEEKDPIEIAATTENVSIYGGSDGSILLTVTGGTEPYLFAWSNGATTADLLDIPAGTYTVTVTDNAGDSETHSEVITQPGPPSPPEELKLEYEKSDVSGVGASDGSIILTITGGTLPYSISWSNGSTDTELTGLAAGLYSVTISDAADQEVSEEIELLAPLKISFSVINATTYNGTDGAIDLLIEGGKSPYSIEWSDASSEEDRTALSGGYYKITVTDAYEKTKSGGTTVYEAFDPAIPEAELLTHVVRLKQSGMRIEFNDLIIYIDPINRPQLYEADADIILVTHNHDDHLSTPIIGQLASSATTLLCPQNCVTAAGTAAPASTILEIAPDSVMTIHDISIEVVPAYNVHHSLPNSVGYILTLDGIRFYHSGDTERITEMTTFDVDIACLPMGQTYTFPSIAEAAQAAEDLGTNVVLPMHYGMYEGNAADPWTFKEMVSGSINVCIKPSLTD